MTGSSEHGIHRIAVVGAGTMGAQIASLIAIHGYQVVLTDAVPDALAKAQVRIDNQILDALVESGAGTITKGDARSRLIANPDLDAAVTGVDLIIEAAREDLEVKIELFAHLDRLNPDAIIASNSSSIPTRQMITKVSNPERVMNMHFFAPIWIRTMLEIMTCGRTAEDNLVRAQQFGQSLGLVSPIVRTESKGFIINRIWRAVKRESLAVLDDGVASAEDIDRMFMIFFQTQQAPFAIMDMVGLDVVRDIEWSYQRDSRDPTDKPSPTLLSMIEDGRLGEKSGEGFYSHPNPAYAQPGFIPVRNGPKEN